MGTEFGLRSVKLSLQPMLKHEETNLVPFLFDFYVILPE